ncbi:MAG: response regulator [Pseudomonadota bacterium]
MKIILVEDDKLIANAITQTLKDASYAVDWVDNGKSALHSIELQSYELMLLDIGLPDKNGFEVLRLLRLYKHNFPVIIITARDAVDERIKGLDLGADDYLVKPFVINELLARIRAVIRRHESITQPILATEHISLDPANNTVSYQNKNILLSAREYALLRIFLLRQGKILSRDELENAIYGWNEEVESNAIEYLIHSVRKKLDKSAIKNIRGLGWMIEKTS